MTVQEVAVAVIVPLCALYAAWLLIGAPARRRVAAWLAAMPLPAAWARRLAGTAAAASACGCDGCDKNEGAAATSAQSIVRVHRRLH